MTEAAAKPAAQAAVQQLVSLAKERKEVAAGVAVGGLVVGGLVLKCLFSGGGKSRSAPKLPAAEVPQRITLASHDGSEVSLLEVCDSAGRRVVADTAGHATVEKGLKVDAVNGRLVNTVKDVEAALLTRPPAESVTLKINGTEVQLSPEVKPDMPEEAPPAPTPEPKHVKEAPPVPSPEPVVPAPITPPQEQLAEPTPVSSPSPEVETSLEPSSVEPSMERSEPEHEASTGKKLSKKPSKKGLKAGGKKVAQDARHKIRKPSTGTLKKDH